MVCEFSTRRLDQRHLSVHSLTAYYNGMKIRIGAPRYVVRVCQSRRVCYVPGCAHDTANSKIIAFINMAQLQINESDSVLTSDYLTAQRLAGWWDPSKIRLRKVLLMTYKHARQGLSIRYREQLSHLYVLLDAALLEARLTDDSAASARASLRSI